MSSRFVLRRAAEGGDNGPGRAVVARWMLAARLTSRIAAHDGSHALLQLLLLLLLVADRPLLPQLPLLAGHRRWN